MLVDLSSRGRARERLAAALIRVLFLACIPEGNFRKS
jgi:hypothetical protein